MNDLLAFFTAMGQMSPLSVVLFLIAFALYGRGQLDKYQNRMEGSGAREQQTLSAKMDEFRDDWQEERVVYERRFGLIERAIGSNQSELKSINDALREIKRRLDK